MPYRELKAPAALATWVEAFWSSAHDPHTSAEPIVPDGCIDWIFTERSRPHGSTCTLDVVGTMTRWQTADPLGSPRRFAVRFRPGAARPLLGVPASELTDSHVALGDLWPGAAALLERLAGLPDDARLGGLAACLTERVRGLERDRAIEVAVERLSRRDCEPVARLGPALGLSERQLRRRFQQAVGVGPKQFARIARLRRLLRDVTGVDEPSWADAAVAAGYYDQSHLCAEFGALTGRTPAEHHARAGSGAGDRFFQSGRPVAT